MYLLQLIEWLEQQDLQLTVPHGFHNPHSYRGYYEDLAFEPIEETTFGNMLEAAQSAYGSTYIGWKGGEFTMNECTTCWIAYQGHSEGDCIGPNMLMLWSRCAFKKEK